MRDKREKDWFWLENDIVDRTDISIYEKMLYVCLARHSYGKDYSFPGLDTLCSELGIKDKRTIVKYAKTLEEKGFITIEKRKGKANKYYLNNIKKVGTPDVGTSDVGSDISCNKVGTSHAQSSDIPCTPNNKRIININNKTTTILEDTKLDIPTNTNTEFLKDDGGSLESRKKEIIAIKQKLQDSNLELLTCKNIMKVVISKNIGLKRLNEVIDFALVKNKSPGFIVAALKDEYDLTIKPKGIASSLRSKKIDKDFLKTRIKMEEENAIKKRLLQEKKSLDTFFDSLPKEKQYELIHTAEEIARKEYGFVWKTMAETKVKYDLIKKFKEVV